MAKQISAEMATNLTLDVTSAKHSLNELTTSVRQSTNEWKVQEAQLRSAGDAIGASEAKYRGLSHTVEEQKTKVEALKQALANNNTETKKGQQQQDFLTKEFQKAQQQLNNYQGQLEKATQAYTYQQTGLAKLNEEVKHNTALTDARVQKLQAEGRIEEAQKVRLEGLRNTQSNYTKILEIQKNELSKLAESGDKSSESYRRQELRVEEMGARLAKVSAQMRSMNTVDVEPKVSGLIAFRERLKDVREQTKQTGSTLKETFQGTFFGNLAIQGIQSMVFGLKSATEAGMEFNKEQDTMVTVWTALTTHVPQDGKELVKYINDLSQHSIYAAENINEMAQSFYHVHSNVDETKRWTDAFVALGSTLHMTGPQLSESGEMFAKIIAGGKASAEDMSVMINRFPMFGEALQEATGKSMKQLYDMSAHGKLTAEVFEKTIDFLGKKYKDGTAEAMTSFQGMNMYISSRWKKLWGDITMTSFKSSKEQTAIISNLLSDKSITEYAKQISSGLSTVFTSVFKVLNYIKNNKNTILDITSNLKTIIGTIANGAWITFKGILKGIGSAFGIFSGSSKKAISPLKQVDLILKAIASHKDALKVLGGVLVGIFAVKKLTNFVLGIKKINDALKITTLISKANPFFLIVGAITAVVFALVELYKHNKKFRAFVDGIIKAIKEFISSGLSWFGDFFSNVGSGFGRLYKSISKTVSRLVGDVLNYFKNCFDTVVNVFKFFVDLFTGHWSNLGKDVKNIVNSLIATVKSYFKLGYDWINTLTGGWLGKMTGGFNNLSTGVTKIFSSMWDGIKGLAKDGINGVIGIINGGISGIDGVIHTFGGPKQALGLIPKFANGTGGAPAGLAVVNDENTADPREAIIDNGGDVHILSGRNKVVNFAGGETVIPASVTRQMFPHFAKGTGNWFTGAVDWVKDKFNDITEFLKHPLKSLTNIMDHTISSALGGASTFVSSLAPAAGKAFVNAIVEPIKKLLGKINDDGGGSQANPGGAGVQRWADLVKKALAANGLSTDTSMVARVLRQIKTESGGNAGVTQPGADPDGDGSGPAIGLMQTKRATFNANKFAGHGDIFNGYDNILAGLHYAKARYGASLSFLGNGHGYANGGLIDRHGLYEIGEGNKPEMVIPLDKFKSSRAISLLNKAVNTVAANNGVSVQHDSNEGGLTQEQGDLIISLLAKLVSQGDSPLPAVISADGVYQAVLNKQKQSQTARNLAMG